MNLPGKISFRPGPLAGPMGRKLKATGETPSEYLRRLVAEDCGKPEPEMSVGNPEFSKQKKRTKASEASRPPNAAILDSSANHQSLKPKGEAVTKSKDHPTEAAKATQQSIVSVPLGDLTTDQLRTVYRDIRDEIWEREYVDRRESNAKLIGNCYRYQNNYSSDCKGWWLYRRVTHIDGQGQLHGISFQDDTLGKMRHEISYMSESSLGDPITREEWDAAFSEFRKLLDSRSR